MWTCLKFWPMKNISKNYKPINQSLIMACLQGYQGFLLFATFLQFHSNSKEASYLYWQNTYPIFKTTCHIKLVFLWTKLLEILLLAKYLISVAAFLRHKIKRESQNWVREQVSAQSKLIQKQLSKFSSLLSYAWFSYFLPNVLTPIMVKTWRWRTIELEPWPTAMWITVYCGRSTTWPTKSKMVFNKTIAKGCPIAQLLLRASIQRHARISDQYLVHCPVAFICINRKNIELLCPGKILYNLLKKIGKILKDFFT